MKEPLEGEIMSTKDDQPRIEDQNTVPNKQRSTTTGVSNTPPYSPSPSNRLHHNDGYGVLDLRDTTRQSYFTLTGWRKTQLIQELALRNLTSRELGAKYEVSPEAVRNFAHRYRHEINLVKQDEDAQIRLLAISSKVNRLAEYQEDVEILNEQIQQRPDPAYFRVKHTALKNAAEEMGHLPPRTNIQVTQQVAYLVGGIDAEDV